MGVIGALLSILLPTLSGARQSARQLSCTTQLRSQVTALHMYADSYQQMPVSSVFIGYHPDRPASDSRGRGFHRLDLPVAIAEFLDAEPPVMLDDGTISSLSPWTCPSESGYTGGDSLGHSYTPDGYSYGYAPNALISGAGSQSYNMFKRPDRVGLGKSTLAYYLQNPTHIILYDELPFHIGDPDRASGATGRNHAHYDGSVKQN